MPLTTSTLATAREGVPKGSSFAWAMGQGAEFLRDAVFKPRLRVKNEDMLAAMRAAMLQQVASRGFKDLTRASQAITVGVAVGKAREAKIVEAMTATEREQYTLLKASHGALCPSTQEAFWAGFKALTGKHRELHVVVDKCALRSKFACFGKNYYELFEAANAGFKDHGLLVVPCALASGGACAGTGVSSACMSLLQSHKPVALLDIAGEQGLVAEAVGLALSGTSLLCSELDERRGGKLVIGAGEAHVGAAFGGVQCVRGPHYHSTNGFHAAPVRSTAVQAQLYAIAEPLRQRVGGGGAGAGDVDFDSISKCAFKTLEKLRPGFFSCELIEDEYWAEYLRRHAKGKGSSLFDELDPYAVANARKVLLAKLNASAGAGGVSWGSARDAFTEQGWVEDDFNKAKQGLVDCGLGGEWRARPRAATPSGSREQARSPFRRAVSGPARPSCCCYCTHGTHSSGLRPPPFAANKCMIADCSCTSAEAGACVCEHAQPHHKASSVAGEWTTWGHLGTWRPG